MGMNRENPWTAAPIFADVLPLGRTLGDCSAPWNWQTLRDAAVFCEPDFPGAGSSPPDTGGVLQPRKSLIMRDLLAMETNQSCTDS